MNNQVIKDAADSALDAACLAIQTHIGTTSGDFAGIYFSDGRANQRIEEILAPYFSAELSSERKRVADRAYEGYDFGASVEESDGWKCDSDSEEVTRGVYLVSEVSGPSVLVHFTVVFEPGTAKVKEAYAINQSGNVFGTPAKDEAPPVINDAQSILLSTYGLGEFSHLADCKTPAELKQELALSCDGLLKFLMVELATKEDCTDLTEALRRIDSAKRQLDQLASAIEDKLV